MKIAVLGAGLGGMSAAIRLANKGYDVEIFEKNSFAGGKARSIKCSEYRFDSGPSLITMPFVIRDLFESVGVNINDYIKIIELDISCRYFFPDGTIVNAYKNIDQFAEEIEKKTKDNKSSFYNFLNYSRKIYELTSDIFLFNNIHSVKTYLKKSSLKSLFQIRKIDAFRTMEKAIRGFFKDEKIVQLFSRYATYNGSSPFLAPATLNIIAYVENELGGYYIKGGMIKLTDALHKLSLKNGVKYNFNSNVTKLLADKCKIKKIITDYTSYEYDNVISNIDSVNTNINLLGEKIRPLNSHLLSSSAIIFYWGIKGIHDELEIHNIIFASNYSKEFHYIFNKGICSDDLTIYIYISSKFNKADAKENCENWFVMVNAPVNNGQDWQSEIGKVRKNIISILNQRLNKNLENLITCEEIISPVDLETITGSYKGSIYGFSSNTKNAAFHRQRNKSNKYKGLYYCGGSVQPGGGIPLVLLSGKLTSNIILKESA